MLGHKLVFLSLICISSFGISVLHGQESPQPPSIQNRTGTSASGLAVIPAELKFDKQAVSTTSAPRILLLTNNSNSPLSGIHILPTADFESSGNCQDIAAGASCSVRITFTPRITGEIDGAVSVFASPAEVAKAPTVVPLRGVGISDCNAAGILWNWSKTTVILILAALYFLGVIVVRWCLIAKRDRAELQAHVESISSWVETYKGATSVQHIVDLLTKSTEALGRSTWNFNALFWARGKEYAGWILVHQAEQQLVAILPFQRVYARMEAVESSLRTLKDAEATAIADKLLKATKTSTADGLERCRALLVEGLSIVHADEEAEFNELDVWHNKMLWLVTCALIFVVALALAFQNPILLLVGAVGGLLSRLSQNLRAAKVDNDYGASWGALFLSPLTGALAAWSGILLVTLAAKLNILGGVLNFDWCNSYDPTVLALALLLGFTERLFGDIAAGLGEKVAKTDKPNSPQNQGSPSEGPNMPPLTRTSEELSGFTTRPRRKIELEDVEEEGKMGPA